MRVAFDYVSYCAILFSFGFDDNEPAATHRAEGSPRVRLQRPPAELSPDTFAKQLRYNDLASMVVCRGNNNKNILGMTMNL